MINLNKKQLTRALNLQKNIVPTHTAMEILKCVLIKINSGIARISATDLSITQNIEIEVDVEQEFELAVPFDLFFKFLKSCTGEKIELDYSDQKLTVKCGDSKLSINCLDPSDFPSVDFDMPKDKMIGIDEYGLDSLIKKTLFSASTQIDRPHLNSIFITKNENEITAVSTDGHRLTLAKSTVPNEDDNFEFILPSQTAKIFSPLLSNFMCDIGVTSDRIFLDAVDDEGEHFKISVSSGLITSQFPPYDSVIPEVFKNTHVVDRCELLSELKKALVAVEKNSKMSIFKFGDSLVINTDCTAGNFVGNVDVIRAVVCDSISVGINIDYIVDVLNAMDEDEVRIQTNSELDPVLFSDNNGFIGVIMPMRI